MPENFLTPPPGGGLLLQNQQLLERLNNLEIILKNMNIEISSLKAENEKLKNENMPKLPNEVDEYQTDDDELSRETNWILQKRKSKKRKAENSPEVDLPKTSNQTNSYLPPAKEKRNLRPPPIMISEVNDYKALYQIIQNEVNENFNIKLLNNNIYKVNVNNSDEYRAVTSALNNGKVSWYSYENKQSRPIKVVVKNLHHSWSNEEIVSHLQNRNFKAISAINKLKFKTKEPLDMFLLSFDATENIKNIYEIKTILNTVVKIEPPKQSKWIPQCKLCQGFNHTKNYCSKQPRCVKCAGKHKTEECLKQPTEKPKCVNCGEEHPANYRGCLVAKELQKLRKKPNQKVITEQKQVIPRLSRTVDSSSYAKIVKSTVNDVSSNQTTCTDDPLAQILQKLNNQELFYQQLDKRLTKLEQQLKLTFNKN